jgi:hypothetical protein
VRHPGGTIEYVGRLSWRPLGHNPMPIVSLGLNRTEVDTARIAAQPSPTIGQWLNGDLGWLEAECNRCKTRASLLLDAIRRPRNTPIWKLEAAPKCRSCKRGPLRAVRPHDQADREAGDHALSVGTSE